MKAIFFSLNKIKPNISGNFRHYSNFSLKVFFKKYGIIAFFTVSLLMGMFFGVIYAKGATDTLYKGLDFLFTTNLNARLTQDFFETFSACFASDFVFMTAIFLLGVTPWGMPFIPIVCAFKGFGTGLSGGFLVESYSLSGFFFYLVVLLPGVFAFCLVLLTQSNLAFYNSKKIFITLFTDNQNKIIPRATMLYYLQKSLTLFIITLGCAVLDTFFWCLISPLFGLV